ncbi:MAG: Holliday junction branch migration protein RuvA [Geobacter sp.]|nr:Holliday junction branch migration protein RuvA [Geobacter sp.]
MIALLTGLIASKAPDTVILDVAGVGYRVQIPFSTYFSLPDDGSRLSLHIHTNVKEDAIHLFGFLTAEEKQFFQLLLSVSGVGPKLARDSLSNIQPDELSAALVRGDLARLSAIPGIGKKSAERLVLELKDKIVKLGLASPSGSALQKPAAAATIRDDVSSALINLGYKDAVVAKTLGDMEISGEESMEAILKVALKRLMK